MAIASEKAVTVAPTENGQQSIAAQAVEKATPTPEIQQINQASSKEETTASKADNDIRPAFKRYLEWKEQYPESVILIKTPGIYFETYREDAVLVADSLGDRLSSVPSKSPQHGRVSLSRVFPTSFDALVDKLQKTASVVAVGADNTVSVYARLEKESQQAGQHLASVVVQQALEQRDPQLHVALTNRKVQPSSGLSKQLKTATEERQPLDLGAAQADTQVQQPLLFVMPTQANTHTEKQPRAEQRLASSVIQRALEQRDPQLHAVLTDKEATVPVEVGQLRDWYAAVQAQQSSKLSEHLKAIAEKGRQAKELGKTHLTTSEAGRMTADIDRFSKSQPETTIGELRTWYRANAAISEGSHIRNIQKMAQNMKATGKNSHRLRPADYVRMEKEVKAFQAQVAREIEPSLRSIWKLAVSNGLVVQERSGKLAFTGVNYSITSTQDETLTLTHKQTNSELSLTKSGKVIKNELTLDDARTLRTISKDLIAASQPRKTAQMQA